MQGVYHETSRNQRWRLSRNGRWEDQIKSMMYKEKTELKGSEWGWEMKTEEWR